MSKRPTDLTPPPARARGLASPPPRIGGTATRRAPTSSRLAREARQQRLAYIGLFAVIILIVATLAVGALAEYVIGPAQPVATVNGAAIRTDTFKRFQNFESAILNNQYTNYQAEIAKLQADTKHATANAQTIQILQQQEQQVQSELGNVPAYTLSQMETALELQQAAAKINQAATPAQLDKQMATLKAQTGYASLVSSTGVQESDLRTYFAAPQVVQNNVTAYFSATVTLTPTQPQAEARHILVPTKQKALALQLAQSIRNGANFAVLAKKYSIDNGLNGTHPVTLTAQQKQQEAQSSAFNGGWLRDPSQPFAPNKPTWLTPQTSFVAPVLNAILSMKPGEVRVVQSQYGWHVIQVTAHRIYHFTKAELEAQRQQQAQTQYQSWYTSATDPAKNKVNPPNPYTQFPAATASP